MKIVIDIPEEVYKYILSTQLYIPGLRSGKSLLEKILKAIRTGTPLPKHGRLGDLSKIYIELNEAQIEGTPEYKGLGVAKQIVCNAKTIIEANKGMKNENL